MNYAQKHKVAMSVFCCFLVAFVTLYAIKIFGVFLFGDLIAWSIWETIDSIKWLSIIYYCFWSILCTYLFVFTLNDKPYSKTWWHYIFIVIIPILCVLGRTYFIPFTQMEFLYDIIQFILTPLLFWFILQKGYKENILYKFAIIILNIIMYFYYLGVKYYSRTVNQLTTLAFTQTTASAHFLINMEIYFGIMLLMILSNLTINYIKESGKMEKPLDIADLTAKQMLWVERNEKKEVKLRTKADAIRAKREAFIAKNKG